MKRSICFLISCLVFVSVLPANKLPEFVQQRLDSVKHNAEIALSEYRIIDIGSGEPRGKLPYSKILRAEFSYEESLLIDSLELDLYIGMIFDDRMRNRIIELIQDKYPEWELDSLANRRMNIRVGSMENDAFTICKFDTMQVFRTALDSVYTDLKNKSITDSLLYKEYTEYETFYKKRMRFGTLKLLKLDTTLIFKQTYRELAEREREKIKEDYIKGKAHFNYTYLTELCGYIGDKRFIQPLIELLSKSNEYQQKSITESLVRMRVEPYYSDYVKQRTRTLEDIKTKKINFRIEDLTDALRTQESFLELSKYLLSETPYRIEYRDPYGAARYPIYTDAFSLIRDNIENEEVQEIIGKGYIKDETPYLIPLYNWMQENYGKYKIKRIW